MSRDNCCLKMYLINRLWFIFVLKCHARIIDAPRSSIIPYSSLPLAQTKYSNQQGQTTSYASVPLRFYLLSWLMPSVYTDAWFLRQPDHLRVDHLYLFIVTEWLHKDFSHSYVFSFQVKAIINVFKFRSISLNN